MKKLNRTLDAFRRADRWLAPLRVFGALAQVPAVASLAAAVAGAAVVWFTGVWTDAPALAQACFGFAIMLLVLKGAGHVSEWLHRLFTRDATLDVFIEVDQVLKLRGTVFGPGADGWLISLYNLRVTNPSRRDRLSLGFTLLIAPSDSPTGWPKYVVEKYRFIGATGPSQPPSHFRCPVEVGPQSTWSGLMEFLLPDVEIDAWVGAIADLDEKRCVLEVRDYPSGLRTSLDLSEDGGQPEKRSLNA